jgi:hypothetical protein
MTTTIGLSLAITHTPWIPARVKSLTRLLAQLDPTGRASDEAEDRAIRFAPEEYRLFEERAPIPVWSEEMWTWAASLDTLWAVFLQDDVIVCDRYLECLSAMLGAAPGPLVGLETVHPAAKTLARTGEHRWCSTADGLIGRAYAIRTDALRDFLIWRQVELKPGGTSAITEDTMFGVYALATGRKIFHPIPALQLHDLALDSAQGNDGDAYRRASVLWSDGEVGGWTQSDLAVPSWWPHDPKDGLLPPPHLGRIWKMTPWLGKKWAKGWTDDVHERAMADVCPAPYAARSAIV